MYRHFYTEQGDIAFITKYRNTNLLVDQQPGCIDYIDDQTRHGNDQWQVNVGTKQFVAKE